MKKTKEENARREFLKICGLTSIPFLLPATSFSSDFLPLVRDKKTGKGSSVVNFISDGLAFSPMEYIQKLNEIDKEKTIKPDYYYHGGVTQQLEKECARITGKEKAIYLPTGTMANQLAIKLLNGSNTKVMVPENSHVYRDEADAAQSVHHKRLIPLGKDKPYFELEDLKQAINYTNENEVFKSGIGTVVIENPVRRANGRAVPLAEIKKIAGFCREKGYKLHLDGARIHLASVYQNVSVTEYASYFDTVYLSLYKYLNATGGAMLCGEAKVIDEVSHHIKILGGTAFQSWSNTAVALHYLENIEDRWREVIIKVNSLIAGLNKIYGITITALNNGTNIYYLKLEDGINFTQLADYLYKEHLIWIGVTNDIGMVNLYVNESLLTRDNNTLINAWKKGIEKARS